MSPVTAARMVAARHRDRAQDAPDPETHLAIAEAFEQFATVIDDRDTCSDDAGCICGCREVAP